ncbi:4359_t:CDS:2, partial [Funneliformis geosporum]
MTKNFLQEIAYHKLFDESEQVVNCYGISQDPQTKKYLMVMKYIPDETMASGLNSIHNKELMHRDFHAGNVLNKSTLQGAFCYVTDLGLCRPANETNDKKIYGVLPYVAPEVLRNKGYAQKADIYSFGIVAYEVLSGLPPYHEYAHDELLTLKICQGLRPNLESIQIPQLLKNLIERNEVKDRKNTEFYQQYKEIERSGGFKNTIDFTKLNLNDSDQQSEAQ